MGESGMGKNGLVLLSYWASSFGDAVRIALEEKGLEYEYVEEDIFNKSSLLVQYNPVYKKVPVLVHNGEPLCESLIIIQYIDQVWSDQPPLLPAEPFARAHARFWADFIQKSMYEFHTKLRKLKGEAQEEAKKEFIEVLKMLEVELGNKRFFNGETFGFVDVALVPFFGRFDAYEKCSADFNIEKWCPKIVAWGRRCMQRESVSKILTEEKRMKLTEFILLHRRLHLQQQVLE